MTQPTYLADFHGQTLEIIEHQGRPWLTAEQAGIALGFKHPRRAVNKIYERHADEFGAEDSCGTKLVLQGDTQARQYRLFSQTGCILLAFFANTPTAKAFRQWAKEVLAGRPDPSLADSYHRLRDEYAALVDRHRQLKTLLLRANRPLAQVARYAALGLNNHEIARLVGRGEHWVRLRKRDLRACGLLPRPATQLRLPLEGGAQ